jgi:hypothetical protein
LKLLARSLSLAALLSIASVANAQVFSETTDAGTTAATAAIVPSGTTSIAGTLGIRFDLDLYAFQIDTAGSIDIIGTNSPGIDDNLLLFDASGFGIGASDDQGGGLDSRITINLSPGLYYVGYGDNNIAAFDSNNNEIFDNDHGDGNGVLNPPRTTPFAYIAQEFAGSGGDTGPYTITFSRPTGGGTPVPEPGSIALLIGAGLGGLMLKRRRK